MADRLAKIYGTEEDKVNCPFYYKIGACRHGDRCARQHHAPAVSQTVLFAHLYGNPLSTLVQEGRAPSREEKEAHQVAFEEFYVELFDELAKFGELEELHVTDNLGEHLIGHCYCKFYLEEDAEKALLGTKGRFFDGRPFLGSYSPVTEFGEGTCRQFMEASCSRAGYCNFLHLKTVPPRLMRELVKTQPHAGENRRSESRSRSPRRGRSRDRGRSRERDDYRRRDRHRDRDDYRRDDYRERRRSKSRDRDYRRDRDRDDRRGRDRDRDRRRSPSPRRRRSRSPDRRDRSERSAGGGGTGGTAE